MFPARITGVEGLVYVCIGIYTRPSTLLCVSLHPDGSATETEVQRKDLET